MIGNSATEENARTWELGDAFEIFVQPAPDGPYYEFHVTPENVRLQLEFPPPPAGEAWNREGQPLPPGSFESETTVDRAGERWTVRATIPFALLGGAPRPGDTWRVSFCRYDWSDAAGPPVLSSSSPLVRLDFHDRDVWREIQF